MNIVYVGSSGVLSVAPLRYLLLAGPRPSAVAVDANTGVSLQDLKSPVIAAANESVEMLAATNGLSVIRLSDVATDYLAEIKACKPDVIIVSCLARKLPEALLAIPRAGCFNLHPSLLPAFRGPAPLFWQFRQGVKNFGMSLHRMTSRIDAGPVVAQRAVSMPDGISNRDANDILAALAVDLLSPFLAGLERGEEPVETMQDETVATSMSYPQPSDFEVSTSWSARRIFNFMRATQHWGQVYRCEVAGRKVALSTALAYQAGAAGTAAAVIHGDSIVIPCRQGTLTARLAEAA